MARSGLNRVGPFSANDPKLHHRRARLRYGQTPRPRLCCSSGVPSPRGSPVGETCRYSVERVIPNSRHKDPTLVSGFPMDAIANRSFAGVILGRRPPFRPRARAEASPARVRSEIRSRSNSAREAKIPKTSLPEGVVVSIAAPWPVRTFKPMPRVVRSCTAFTRWRRLRPSRSSFQTTSVSLCLRACKHAAKPGRSSFFPEAMSL